MTSICRPSLVSSSFTFRAIDNSEPVAKMLTSIGVSDGETTYPPLKLGCSTISNNFHYMTFTIST